MAHFLPIPLSFLLHSITLICVNMEPKAILMLHFSDTQKSDFICEECKLFGLYFYFLQTSEFFPLSKLQKIWSILNCSGIICALGELTIQLGTQGMELE